MTTHKVSNKWAGGGLKSLVAKASTGAGDAFDLRSGFQTFSIQCDVTGSTSVKVVLQGSVDGTNFANIGSTNGWRLSAQGDLGMVTVATTAPVQHVRLRVATISTGNGKYVDGWIGVA